MTRAEKRNLLAGAIGNTIEFYDFIIYAYLAVFVAEHFFPAGDGVTAMLNEYRTRRDAVHGWLTADPRIVCVKPGGAFYAFPNIKGTGRTSPALARALLEEAHVAVIHGESFGANGADYLRLSYAAPEPDLRQAIARMAAFLQ